MMDDINRAEQRDRDRAARWSRQRRRPTLNEQIADGCDIELYRLIVKAERLSKNNDAQISRCWREAAACMRLARGYIRSMMAEEKRTETT